MFNLAAPDGFPEAFILFLAYATCQQFKWGTAFLLHQASSHPEIMWHQEYRQEVEFTEKSPEALVNGWNAALRFILSAFDADLNRTLHPR